LFVLVPCILCSVCILLSLIAFFKKHTFSLSGKEDPLHHSGLARGQQGRGQLRRRCRRLNKSFAAWANAPIVPSICFTYEGAPVSFTRKEQPLTLLFTPDGIDQLPGYTVAVAEWSTAFKAQDDGADISDTTILLADFNIDTMSDVFGSLHLYLPNVPENNLPEVLKIAGITAEVVARTNNKGKNTGFYTLLVRGYEVSKPACSECQVLTVACLLSCGPRPNLESTQRTVVTGI
jgi:hypothetical protein